LAQAVTFVTGHAAPDQGGGGFGEPDLDWPSLARANHTVVVYMGLSTAGVISARLIAAGRASATPVLVVENASQPIERRALTTLASLPEAAKAFDAPSILIIGETAALADLAGLSATPPLGVEVSAPSRLETPA
jgi:uroporphyrin-III C-methyltransferase